jgi:hypothetical protein
MSVDGVKDLMMNRERELHIRVVGPDSPMFEVVKPVPPVSFMEWIVGVKAVVGV